MNEEAQEMDSISIRVNELERAHSLHNHRLKVLEDERLPNRMALTERSAAEAKEGVEHLRAELNQLRKDQAEGFRTLEQAIGRIGSLFKGAMWAFGVVGTLLIVLNLVVDLIPKLDAPIYNRMKKLELIEFLPDAGRKERSPPSRTRV